MTTQKLKAIPKGEWGGGRKEAVMTECFVTLERGCKWPNKPNTPVQWVPKNRARDMERHYMQIIEDLEKRLK